MNSIYFLAPASKIRESCSFSVVFPTQIESFRVCLLDETNPFEGLKGTWGVVMIFRINKQPFFFTADILERAGKAHDGSREATQTAPAPWNWGSNGLQPCLYLCTSCVFPPTVKRRIVFCEIAKIIDWLISLTLTPAHLIIRPRTCRRATGASGLQTPGGNKWLQHSAY